MSVPKSKRKESRFEAQHNLYILRKEVTNLVVADFGFSEEKYLEQMERYRAAHRSAENVDEVCARWQEKCEGFKVWYVDEEGRAILDLMRSIQTEFGVAHSVFPSRTHAKLLEFLQRRWHMNRAIGYCYALKQDIQYAIETLSVDIKKFEWFADRIDREIALIRGVRQASNSMIKPPGEERPGSLTAAVGKACTAVAEILWKIGKIESGADG